MWRTKDSEKFYSEHAGRKISFFLWNALHEWKWSVFVTDWMVKYMCGWVSMWCVILNRVSHSKGFTQPGDIMLRQHVEREHVTQSQLIISCIQRKSSASHSDVCIICAKACPDHVNRLQQNLLHKPHHPCWFSPSG